ncbi:MAG: LapA family protein [Clostridiales bacterium]|nr:LapA family protein [Clostridiales bacterium]
MQITFILSMMFAVIISVFALANSAPVTISFIFTTFELSQAVVILVSAVIGAVVVFFLNLFSKAKSAMKTKGLTKQAKEMESKFQTCQTQLQTCQTQLELYKKNELDLNEKKNENSETVK